MWLVTAVIDKYEANGVEIAGYFTKPEIAYEAKAEVEKWMHTNGFDNAEVMVTKHETNKLTWHEIEKKF